MGLGDYIRDNAPVAINMPIDVFFCGPWATDEKYKAKHRELTKCIGESIRGKLGGHKREDWSTEKY